MTPAEIRLRVAVLRHLNAAHRVVTDDTGPYDAGDLAELLDAIDAAIAAAQRWRAR